MAIPQYRGKGYRSTAREFFDDSLGFVLRRQAELGDLYRIRLPFRRLYISTDPAFFQEVLVNRQRQCRKSPAYREMGIALGNGLLTSEGDFWLHQRRLMQPAFHRGALEKLYAVMREETEAWLEDLARRVRLDPVVDLSQEMMRLTSEIALRTLFSSGSLRDSREVAGEILRTQAYVLWRVERPWLQPFFSLLPGYWRFRRDIRRFDQTVYDLIRQRRESGVLHQDLLDLLLHARDADSGEGMSDRQLRDEIITLYVAGHDTSANTLAWACQLLMDHPEVGQALGEEARTRYGTSTPDGETLRVLGLARQVSDETLRLYPPAHAIGREVAEPFSWQGETFSKGSILLLSIYGLHRHPGLWAEPDSFRPERFAGEAAEGRHKYAFLPFGAGPRLCIGAQFALQEIPLILSALFRRFRVHPLEGERPRPTGLLTLKPLPAVRARLEEVGQGA
jgi:cytochrome P450